MISEDLPLLPSPKETRSESLSRPEMITRTFASGDILEIDQRQYTVLGFCSNATDQFLYEKIEAWQAYTESQDTQPHIVLLYWKSNIQYRSVMSLREFQDEVFPRAEWYRNAWELQQIQIPHLKQGDVIYRILEPSVYPGVVQSREGDTITISGGTGTYTEAYSIRKLLKLPQYLQRIQSSGDIDDGLYQTAFLNTVEVRATQYMEQRKRQKQLQEEFKRPEKDRLKEQFLCRDIYGLDTSDVIYISGRRYYIDKIECGGQNVPFLTRPMVDQHLSNIEIYVSDENEQNNRTIKLERLLNDLEGNEYQITSKRKIISLLDSIEQGDEIITINARYYVTYVSDKKIIYQDESGEKYTVSRDSIVNNSRWQLIINVIPHDNQYKRLYRKVVGLRTDEDINNELSRLRAGQEITPFSKESVLCDGSLTLQPREKPITINDEQGHSIVLSVDSENQSILKIAGVGTDKTDHYVRAGEDHVLIWPRNNENYPVGLISFTQKGMVTISQREPKIKLIVNRSDATLIAANHYGVIQSELPVAGLTIGDEIHKQYLYQGNITEKLIIKSIQYLPNGEYYLKVESRSKSDNFQLGTMWTVQASSFRNTQNIVLMGEAGMRKEIPFGLFEALIIERVSASSLNESAPMPDIEVDDLKEEYLKDRNHLQSQLRGTTGAQRKEIEVKIMRHGIDYAKRVLIERFVPLTSLDPKVKFLMILRDEVYVQIFQEFDGFIRNLSGGVNTVEAFRAMSISNTNKGELRKVFRDVFFPEFEVSNINKVCIYKLMHPDRLPSEGVVVNGQHTNFFLHLTMALFDVDN